MFNKKMLEAHPKSTLPDCDIPKSYCVLYEKYDEETLVMNIYQRTKDGKHEMLYRTFHHRDEYITQDGKEVKKWYTGSLERLTSLMWWGCTEINGEIAKEFCDRWALCEDMRQYRRIMSLQSKIMEIKRNKRFEKEAARIDVEMQKFPALPKGTDKFFIKTVFKNNNLMFYDKKKKTGYCTHCEKDVSLISLQNYKHKDIGKCPECKTSVTFYSKGISRKYLYLEGTGVVFQRHNDELLARYFHISKYFNNMENFTPEIVISEVVRTIFNSEKIVNYEYRSFHRGSVRWCKCVPRQGYYYYDYDVNYNSCRAFSFLNLAKAIKKTPYEYSEVTKYLRKAKKSAFAAENYLSEYIKYPVVEKFIKLGMFDIAKEFLRKGFKEYDCDTKKYVCVINMEEKEFHKMLGITKQQFRVLNSVKNPSFKFLEYIKENNTNKVYTKEEYQFINKKCKSTRDCRRLFKILDKHPRRKIMRYLENRSVSTYLDYLDFCMKLGYDLRNSFVLFPKNLDQAHDEAMLYIKEEESKEMFNKINSMLPDIAERYNFKYGDFVIIAPTDAKDLVKESQALHNCISRNYMKPFSTGECVILFIRKIDDINKPFFAMEISSNRVVQVRGMDNCDATDEVNNCVEMFKKEKLKAA